jgi:hypothetical protein
VIRYDNGISIRFTRSLWRAAIYVVTDFAEGGLEGLLLLAIAPLTVVGAMVYAFVSGFGVTAMALLAVGIGLIAFALLRLVAHEGGPEISVRGGRVTYRDSKVQDGALRECAVADVVSVETGEAHPVIRKRGGNELLGGFDAIDIDEYRRLSPAAKRWVTQTLLDAIGLPTPSPDHATGGSIG